jgi:hypothetical protein
LFKACPLLSDVRLCAAYGFVSLAHGCKNIIVSGLGYVLHPRGSLFHVFIYHYLSALSPFYVLGLIFIITNNTDNGLKERTR